MTITLEMPPTIAAKLTYSEVERRRAEQLLVAAFGDLPATEVASPVAEKDEWLDQFEQMRDELVATTAWHGAAPLSDYALSRASLCDGPDRFGQTLDELALSVPPDVPPLSNFAVSRESLYDEQERHGGSRLDTYGRLPPRLWHRPLDERPYL